MQDGRGVKSSLLLATLTEPVSRQRRCLSFNIFSVCSTPKRKGGQERIHASVAVRGVSLLFDYNSEKPRKAEPRNFQFWLFAG